ncbi:MAG: high-potential iron-sulfur protein [Pseudomonadales bacterium]
MKSKNQFTRRTFIATSAVGAMAVSRMASAATTLPRLKVDEPIALALGYQPDADDVDVTKYPKRAGAEGATQLCSNCRFYQATADGYGTCSAIPGKLVAGPGWCNAWIPIG